MKVKVANHGTINFPDDMAEKDIRAFLKQFEAKRDDTLPKLLETFEKLLKQKPHVVTEQKLVEVEKQIVVKEPEIQMVEKIIERDSKPSSYRFTIYRDEDGISEVVAEPING